MRQLCFSQYVTASDYPPFALVTLNQEIQSTYYRILAKRASFHVCADGGFDRLLHYCRSHNVPLSEIQPHVLVGDFDSISPTGLDAANRAGVRVEKVHCQDTTDFQKAIKVIERQASADFGQALPIIVFGAIDGRFDHTIASISVLYEYPEYEIWLLSGISLITLLPGGTNTIRLDFALEGPTCGILPLNGKCTTSSTGLKYELHDLDLEVGQLVSSSNSAESERITITTDRPLAWTVQLNIFRH